MNPEEAWTWEQFLETARALTVDVNGNHPGDAGFDINNVDRWGVHWPNLSGSTQLHAAIAANGGDWIDPQTEFDRTRHTGGHAGDAKHRRPDAVHQVMPMSTAVESLGMTNTQMLETGKLGHGDRGLVGTGLDEEH